MKVPIGAIIVWANVVSNHNPKTPFNLIFDGDKTRTMLKYKDDDPSYPTRGFEHLDISCPDMKDLFTCEEDKQAWAHFINLCVSDPKFNTSACRAAVATFCGTAGPGKRVARICTGWYNKIKKRMNQTKGFTDIQKQHNMEITDIYLNAGVPFPPAPGQESVVASFRILLTVIRRCRGIIWTF